MQPRDPTVDHEVVDHEVRGAVRGHADADRNEHLAGPDPDADRQHDDRRGGEDDGEEVVRLEHASRWLVMAPVPPHAATVEEHSVRDRGDRLHEHERGEREQHPGHDGTFTLCSRWPARSQSSIASVSSVNPKR